MNLLLTTKCFSKCKFCFVPDNLKHEQDEMSFVQFKQYLEHINEIYKTNKPVVGILGGEPTLAKDFPMIIGYAKTYTGGIRLYSNLITNTKNIEYLLGARNIVLVWNVGSYVQTNEKNKKLVLKNLSIIKNDFQNNIIASITLYDNFQIKDFDSITTILKKYKINNIRIALDSTKYQSFINSGTQVYNFVKHLKKLNFNIYSSSCGHFVQDMFTKEQEEYLKNHINNFNYNNCSLNYPLDILPDGTVVPCVSFAKYKSNLKFLEFKTLNVLNVAIKKKFKLADTTNKFCAANCYSENRFKIITGFNPMTYTIDYLRNNNIKEIYCGYYDKESEKKWPVSFGCMNRRGEGVNFYGWDKLLNFSKQAIKENIKVFLTLNSHYYIKEQYSWLKHSIQNINQEKSIAGVIVNDIGLLMLLKQLKFKKNITLSTLAACFNSNAINFYKKFGVNRIVLDRQLTPYEIVDLAVNHKDIEFEIFVVSTGGCLFIDGGCSLLHCFEQLKNNVNISGRIVRAKKYDITTPGAGCCTILNCFTKKQFNIYSNNKQKFDISKTLGFGCNICMLYQLKDIPNIALKIDSRGSNGLGVTTISMLNDLINAVDTSKNNSEYTLKAKQILYEYKKIKCNSKICLYYKN